MEDRGETSEGEVVRGGRGLRIVGGGWSWNGGWSRMRTSETIVHGGRRLVSSGSLATMGPRRNEPRRGKGRQSRL